MEEFTWRIASGPGDVLLKRSKNHGRIFDLPRVNFPGANRKGLMGAWGRVHRMICDVKAAHSGCTVHDSVRTVCLDNSLF